MAETPKTAFVTLNVEGTIAGWQVLNDYHLAGLSMEGALRWEKEVNSPSFIASLHGTVPLAKLTELLEKVDGVTHITIHCQVGKDKMPKWPMPSLTLLRTALAELAAKPEGFDLTWGEPMMGLAPTSPAVPPPATKEAMWAVLDIQVHHFVQEGTFAEKGHRSRLLKALQQGNNAYVGDVVTSAANNRRQMPSGITSKSTQTYKDLERLLAERGLSVSMTPSQTYDWKKPTER